MHNDTGNKVEIIPINGVMELKDFKAAVEAGEFDKPLEGDAVVVNYRRFWANMATHFELEQQGPEFHDLVESMLGKVVTNKYRAYYDTVQKVLGVIVEYISNPNNHDEITAAIEELKGVQNGEA